AGGPVAADARPGRPGPAPGGRAGVAGGGGRPAAGRARQRAGRAGGGLLRAADRAGRDAVAEDDDGRGRPARDPPGGRAGPTPEAVLHRSDGRPGGGRQQVRGRRPGDARGPVGRVRVPAGGPRPAGAGRRDERGPGEGEGRRRRRPRGRQAAGRPTQAAAV
ncbi:MAG: hypothetical protein AVDCRST_MAG64-1599, partial [uncultured Phycisphaerae bacterium]